MMIYWTQSFGYQARVVLEKKQKLSFDPAPGDLTPEQKAELNRVTSDKNASRLVVDVRVRGDRLDVMCRKMMTGATEAPPNVTILTSLHPNQKLPVETRNIETFEGWLDTLTEEWTLRQIKMGPS